MAGLSITSSAAGTCTGDSIWTSWHSDDTSYTCTMDTGTGSDTIWASWFVSSTTTATVTYDNVWRLWIQANDDQTASIRYRYDEPVVPIVRTPEQIEAERVLFEQRRIEREAALAKIRAQQLEEQKQRAIAAEKANLLLMALLNAKQREEYAKTQTLTVISKDGRRTYQIVNRGSNVYLVDEKGKRLKHYCIYPDALVPQEDTVAAKLLMLRHAEPDFLKIANASNAA